MWAAAPRRHALCVEGDLTCYPPSSARVCVVESALARTTRSLQAPCLTLVDTSTSPRRRLHARCRPGIGGSSYQRSLSITSFANDCVTLLDTLGVGKVRTAAGGWGAEQRCSRDLGMLWRAAVEL